MYSAGKFVKYEDGTPVNERGLVYDVYTEEFPFASCHKTQQWLYFLFKFTIFAVFFSLNFSLRVNLNDKAPFFFDNANFTTFFFSPEAFGNYYQQTQIKNSLKMTALPKTIADPFFTIIGLMVTSQGRKNCLGSGLDSRTSFVSRDYQPLTRCYTRLNAKLALYGTLKSKISMRRGDI